MQPRGEVFGGSNILGIVILLRMVVVTSRSGPTSASMPILVRVEFTSRKAAKNVIHTEKSWDMTII